jgi:translocation and assembly module TamB
VSEAAPPIAKQASRRGLRLAATLAGAVALFAGSLAGGLWWGLATASGSAWLLHQLPGIQQLDAPSGSLLGDFSARRLVWSSGDWRIDAQQLRWQGLSLSRKAAPGAWAQIDVQGLQAARLEIAFPSSATDLPTPQELTLPVGLKIGSVRIAELALPALGRDAAPLRALDASLALGDEQGRTHRLELRNLDWEHWRLQGSLSQGALGEMRTQASLQAQRSDGGSAGSKDWRASATLAGPLPSPQLQARIEGLGQHLDLQAELAPLAAWPLRLASVSARDFDLAALTPRLPATALNGDAQLRFAGLQQPAQLKAQLGNDRAGRWDQGRLPLRRLTLDLSARPDGISHWQQQTRVDALELLLGSAGEPAGRVSAQGTLQSLRGQIAELRPTALDSRLPRLQLGGALTLQGQAASDSKTPAMMQLDGMLNGQWQTPRGAQPVRMAIKAESNLASTLTLQALQLSSGEATLQAEAKLARGDDGRWRAELAAQAQGLDPRLLWGGRDGSAWQRGRHELNATLQATLAQAAGGTVWPGGEARLQLQPSQLNGMPLAGELSYRADAAAAQPPQLQGEFNAAGNQLQLRAGVDGLATLELRADALAGLQPLLALWQPQARIAGAARLRAELSPAEAQKPTLAGDWQLALKGSSEKLVLGTLSLGSASVDARAGTRLDAPLQLNAEARQLLVSGARLSQATLGVSGSWARHQLKLDGKGSIALPAWLATLAGSDSSHAPLSAAAQFDGQFSESPWLALRGGNGSGKLNAAPALLLWQARAGSLQLRPDKPGLPAWFDAEDLALNLSVDPRHKAAPLQRLALAAGHAELAGARVRWRELAWQPAAVAGALPELSADIELEPLAVAPLLSRWQPDFGWGGDLVMGGQVHLRSSPAMHVDIVLQRTEGDLSVTDDAGVHALGLSELRLGLLAQDGRWHLTQAIAGEQLGAIGGAITALTSPQAAWPGADAALEGVLTAHVANLGNWGAWVPPGWRLGGRLDAGISLAGKLGAPEIKGQASGEQIAVRNPLLGVDVDQGHFTLALDGATATLKELGARGGDGTISAQGAVELGETPLAQLNVQAQRFRLLNRVDRRLVASGKGTLELGRQTLALDGRFAFDEGLFDFSRADAPALDEDVRVQRPHAPAQAAPTTRRASERRISTKLALDFGEKLRVFGRGLDTHLRGELLLSHAQGRPQLGGTLRAVGGTYEAYGQRLEIEKGELVFVGALDNPRLDVLAVRPNTDEVKVGVTLTGTALNPRVKLYSEPELSEAEKIAWLVLGRGPDTLGRSDTLLVQRAALALLAGEGGGTTGKLMKNLGLDEVSVGQDVDETRGTVVRVGKQISRRVYLGYERSLNATTGSWQLIYRIAQRFTLRAQSGEQNAMDLIWQWQWR